MIYCMPFFLPPPPPLLLPEILTSTFPIAQAVTNTEMTPRKIVIGLRNAARKGYVYVTWHAVAGQ